MDDNIAYDYSINVFEFILGYSADEWRELNLFLDTE